MTGDPELECPDDESTSSMARVARVRMEAEDEPCQTLCSLTFHSNEARLRHTERESKRGKRVQNTVKPALTGSLTNCTRRSERSQRVRPPWPYYDLTTQTRSARSVHHHCTAFCVKGSGNRTANRHQPLANKSSQTRAYYTRDAESQAAETETRTDRSENND